MVEADLELVGDDQEPVLATLENFGSLRLPDLLLRGAVDAGFGVLDPLVLLDEYFNKLD